MGDAMGIARDANESNQEAQEAATDGLPTPQAKWLRRAEISLDVSLLSGRSCRLSMACNATVMDVLRKSREALNVDVSRLYWLQQPLQRSHKLCDVGLEDGAQLTAVAADVQIISSLEALAAGANAWPLSCCNEAPDGSFLAIRTDGQVLAWGGLACSESFRKELTDFCEIRATVGAFAVLRPDGSVCTWGKAGYGADRSKVKPLLEADVCAIYATSKSFAALKRDGSVVSWGGPRFENFGGDSSRVQEQLQEVREIKATHSAFAALKADGSVVCWGNSCEGGDCSRVAEQLKDVRQLCAAQRAFCALRADGSTVSWGVVAEGGGSYMVQEQLHSVVELSASSSAFSALRSDGQVVSWGDFLAGGRTCEEATGVVKVVGNDCAFAGLRHNGSVVTWGDAKGGGDSIAISAELIDIKEIRPFFQCFVALRKDHSAILWGRGKAPQIFRDVVSVAVTKFGVAALNCDGSVQGSDDEWQGVLFDTVKDQLNEQVLDLHVTAGAFAAVKVDGQVITWGGPRYGGDSTSVRDMLDPEGTNQLA